MKLHLEHQNINQAAIDSIARHASKVKGRHRNNEVKEAILLIRRRRRRRRRRSNTCDDICSDCGEVCGEIRRNMATFHSNIPSNLCSLENKSMILGVFWW